MDQAIEMRISWIVPEGCCPSHNDFSILRVVIFLHMERYTGGDCVSASYIVCSEIGLTIEEVQSALRLLVWNESVVAEKAPGPTDVDVYRLREDVRVIFRS